MPMPIDLPGTLARTWTELMQMLAAQGYDVIAIEQGAVQITTQQQMIEYLKQFNIKPVYTLIETFSGFAQVSAVDPANTTAVTVGTGTAVTVAQGAAQDITMTGSTTWGIVKKGIAITAAISLLVASLDANLITNIFRDDLENTATDFTIDGENIPVQITSEGKTYYQADFLNAIRQKLVDLGVFDGGTDVPSAPVNFPSISPVTVPFRVLTPGKYTIPLSDGRYEVIGIGNDTLAAVFNNTATPTRFYIILISSTDSTTAQIGFTNSSDPDAAVTLVTYNLNQNYTFDGKRSASATSSVTLGPGVVFNVNDVSQTYGSGTLSTNIQSYLGWLLQYAREGGQGVEGVTPKSDIDSAAVKNPTKPLTEIIPNLGTAIQTATPTDEDLTETTDWFPVSSIGVDALNDGLTDDQSATATDGLPDDQTKDAIIEDLLKALQELMRDPDNPDAPVIPVIEVGDSGDTPPAEPPLLSGSSNGLWAIYNPSLQQVHDFGAWLWSDNIIDSIKRQFSNSPIDAVIGFHMIYCTPITGSQKTIKAGYLDSPVQAAEVTNQYAEIDCGTVTVTEFYGNAIDYMKTRIALYLPFIGIVPLDAGVVMGSTLSLKYRIDVLTGTCLAQVTVIKENSSAVIYTYQGNCSVQIPLTGATYTGMVGALLGGVTAGVSVMTGNLAGAAAGVKGAISSLSQGHNIQHSGTIGSNAGALGIRIPYLIVTHPVQRMPVDYAAIEGIPSNYSVRIGDCSGYTRVIYGHMENITGATADELQMIRDALMEGIII